MNHISFDSRNIARWWRGEITGKRVAVNLIEAVGSVAGGVGGGFGGAAIGGLLGPLGAVIGGVVGGVVTALVSEKVLGEITHRIFDIPKDEALENAFRYCTMLRNLCQSFDKIKFANVSGRIFKSSVEHIILNLASMAKALFMIHHRPINKLNWVPICRTFKKKLCNQRP